MNPENPTAREQLEARVTALLLGELPADEAAALREQISQDADLKALRGRLERTIGLVRETAADPVEQTAEQPAPMRLSEERREKLLAQFKTIAPREFARPKPRYREWLVPMAAAVAVIAIMAAEFLPSLAKSKAKSQAHSLITVGELEGPKNEVASQKAEDAASLGGGVSNVFSVNVVGYVNLNVTSEYTLMQNPLDDGKGSIVTNVVESVPPPVPPSHNSIVLPSTTEVAAADNKWVNSPALPLRNGADPGVATQDDFRFRFRDVPQEVLDTYNRRVAQASSGGGAGQTGAAQTDNFFLSLIATNGTSALGPLNIVAYNNYKIQPNEKVADDQGTHVVGTILASTNGVMALNGALTNLDSANYVNNGLLATDGWGDKNKQGNGVDYRVGRDAAEVFAWNLGGPALKAGEVTASFNTTNNVVKNGVIGPLFDDGKAVWDGTILSDNGTLDIGSNGVKGNWNGTNYNFGDVPVAPSSVASRQPPSGGGIVVLSSMAHTEHYTTSGEALPPAPAGTPAPRKLPTTPVEQPKNAGETFAGWTGGAGGFGGAGGGGRAGLSDGSVQQMGGREFLGIVTNYQVAAGSDFKDSDGKSQAATGTTQDAALIRNTVPARTVNPVALTNHIQAVFKNESQVPQISAAVTGSNAAVGNNFGLASQGGMGGTFPVPKMTPPPIGNVPQSGINGQASSEYALDPTVAAHPPNDVKEASALRRAASPAKGAERLMTPNAPATTSQPEQLVMRDSVRREASTIRASDVPGLLVATNGTIQLAERGEPACRQASEKAGEQGINLAFKTDTLSGQAAVDNERVPIMNAKPADISDALKKLASADEAKKFSNDGRFSVSGSTSVAANGATTLTTGSASLAGGATPAFITRSHEIALQNADSKDVQQILKELFPSSTNGGLGSVSSTRDYPNSTMMGPVMTSIDPETGALIVITDDKTWNSVDAVISNVNGPVPLVATRNSFNRTNFVSTGKGRQAIQESLTEVSVRNSRTAQCNARPPRH